jgi:hypothetical protein
MKLLYAYVQLSTRIAGAIKYSCLPDGVMMSVQGTMMSLQGFMMFLKSAVVPSLGFTATC